MEITVVIPCLNEAETLEVCIKKTQNFFKQENIKGEVLVSDNGSSDGSQEIATRNGVTLIHAEEKGYGAALFKGIESAKGKFVIMGDADDSYDFSDLMPFIEKLREGYDLVLGNRFKGGIKKGAMPFMHRYFGNPLLSFIGRMLFKNKIKDFYCGLRGFTKEAFKKMRLHTTGMEFALEMIVKATMNKMKITEVPTTLSPDGRTKPPHLRTWRDGWRSLRFFLMFAPKWLFFYPGMVIIILSFLLSVRLFLDPIQVKSVVFDIHTLIISSFIFLLGFQLVFFHWFAKIFSITSGIVPSSERFEKTFRVFSLERGILLGLLIIIIGLLIISYNFYSWKATGFSDLNPTIFVRKILVGIVSFTLGIQIVIYSFILSIVGLKKK